MKVSIVIPTWNGEDEIGECLRGVFSQHVEFDLEVLVIDSSSTDRTLEIASKFPVRVHQIAQGDFNHGDTRNLGAQMTDGDLIVFLVQDAYPERRDWLLTLVNNFSDPTVGAAFCRILPRPTAGMLVRRGVLGDLCFGDKRIENQITDPATYHAMDPLTRRIFINFNDVCSCMRRTVWERLPFARIQFGEDLLWAKGALEAGYKIVFDPNAAVIHSHEYDPKTLAARTEIDAWLNQAYLDRCCIRSRKDALIMTRRTAKEDLRFLKQHGVKRWKRFKLGILSHWYHLLEFWGFFRGSHTDERLRSPQAVPQPKLKILFAVHGFPPETFAGTENLTFSLAKGLQRAGHDVTVFHRVADPSLENYAIEEGEWAGLRVIKIANHLQFKNIRETYQNPEVEARFRDVLRREKPDVVHLEHMIHLSAGLLSVCREEGIGSVVTLNDFWFRCPKVQLIRDDKKVCAGKPPILGCAACVAGKPGLIAPLKFFSRPIRGLLERAGRRYLALAEKNPRWFRKHASDLACMSIRPGAMIRELNKADFVIAPSRFLKEKMVEAGMPRDRLIVSDYGMETAWVDGYQERAPDGKVRFAFIGSLVWYKGLEVLARAFQRIADPAAELHIYGDTEGLPEFRETRARIEGHVQRGGLHFHGRYDPKELATVLGAIDVLVVPSVWYENSPLAIHEAFQSRIPVLVSDRGGMRDLVQDGAGGLRFRPDDDADLAGVMRRFLDEPLLRAQLAEAAPSVKTIDDNVREMEVKYRQAVGLHLAYSPVATVDLWDYRDSRGDVEKLGDNQVLLRPGREGAEVVYELITAGALAVELRIGTKHLGGEAGIIQGGEVRVNGRRVLRILPRAAAEDDADHVYHAPLRVTKGKNRISVASRIRGPGGGRFHLRIMELSLHRTGTRLP